MSTRQQAIIWTSIVYWRIYASLSLNELNHQALVELCDWLVNTFGAARMIVSVLQGNSEAYGHNEMTNKSDDWPSIGEVTLTNMGKFFN